MMMFLCVRIFLANQLLTIRAHEALPRRKQGKPCSLLPLPLTGPATTSQSFRLRWERRAPAPALPAAERGEELTAAGVGASTGPSSYRTASPAARGGRGPALDCFTTS